jgi:hypothetical protein
VNSKIAKLISKYDMPVAGEKKPGPAQKAAKKTATRPTARAVLKDTLGPRHAQVMDTMPEYLSKLKRNLAALPARPETGSPEFHKQVKAYGGLPSDQYREIYRQASIERNKASSLTGQGRYLEAAEALDRAAHLMDLSGNTEGIQIRKDAHQLRLQAKVQTLAHQSETKAPYPMGRTITNITSLNPDELKNYG